MSSTDEELNERVLREMQAAGDDLAAARPVEFQCAFPDRSTAELFAKEAIRIGLSAEISESGCVPELPWDVYVTKIMRPEVKGISALERDLGALSAKYSGRSDGWSCERLTGR
jgi:Regulator of ribonuclease activity B